MQTFPDIDGAQNWYLTTKASIAGLRDAVANRKEYICDEVADEIWGMPDAEWKLFYNEQIDQHDMFATLALFATCEGGIRRDFLWRSSGNYGQSHYQKFNKLRSDIKQKHVPLHRILDTWKAAIGRNHWFINQLNILGDLFVVQRNELAHGKDNPRSYVFGHIYNKLDTIRCKWRDVTKDFDGF